MSSTETEQVRAREVLVRTFHVETEMPDDHTIDVRIVPFDEVAEVADPPDFVKYREQFMPGVFAHQENAANRVYLRVGQGHDGLDELGRRKPGLAGVIGHGRELLARADGYYGRFKMHNNSETETARELVREGVLTGVSAEFLPTKTVRTRDGIVQRVKANLSSVLLCPNPAYSRSEVLAMRAEPEIVMDESDLPPAPDLELLARCAKAGIALPERYAALLEEEVPSE